MNKITLLDEILLDGCVFRENKYDEEKDKIYIRYISIDKINSEEYSVKILYDDNVLYLPISEKNDVIIFIKTLLYDKFVINHIKTTDYSKDDLVNLYIEYLENKIRNLINDINDIDDIEYKYSNYFYKRYIGYLLIKDIIKKGVMKINLINNRSVIIIYTGYQFVVKEYRNDKFYSEFGYSIYNLDNLSDLLELYIYGMFY